MSWNVFFTAQARKDARGIDRAGHRPRTESLLELLRRNPFETPPPYEKLLGDLAGAYSRRITIHHRLVYHVPEEERAVKVLRMWTHYE